MHDIFKTGAFRESTRWHIRRSMLPPYCIKQISVAINQETETKLAILSGERESQATRCVECRNDQELITRGCSARGELIEPQYAEQCLLIALSLFVARVSHGLALGVARSLRNGHASAPSGGPQRW